MAKKHDFIEKENRTTIAGIVGIVIIVLLVASYMKIQQIAFFAPEENVAGLASESFLGVRYVQLTEHQALVGHLSVQDVGTYAYYVYPDDKLLVIDHGDSYEQIVLSESNGQYAGSDGRVNFLATPAVSQLLVDGLTSFALPPITLTPLKVFDGELSVAGQEHYFRLLANELLITGPEGKSVILLTTTNEGLLGGSWNGREIVVNADDAVVIVHNIY